MVKLLLSHQPEVNAATEDGNTALLLNAREGKVQITEELLRKGADVSARNRNGVTALMAAAFYGNGPVVKRLLENGAAVNTACEQGETPLILAGSADATRVLLEHGAAVNARDEKGRSALMEAAVTGNRDAVAALLDNGADVDMCDENGASALLWAVRSIELELQNDMTWNLVRYMCGLYHEKSAAWDKLDNLAIDIVTLLLNRKAHVNCRDRDGWTALKVAAMRGKRKLAALLRGAGAELSKRDTLDLEFLRAVKNGRMDKTRRLINRGVDVNTRNEKGAAGLAIAAYWNHVEIVRLLLSSGADPGNKGPDGLTALEWAQHRKHQDVVELLTAAFPEPDEDG